MDAGWFDGEDVEKGGATRALKIQLHITMRAKTIWQTRRGKAHPALERSLNPESNPIGLNPHTFARDEDSAAHRVSNESSDRSQRNSFHTSVAKMPSHRLAYVCHLKTSLEVEIC